MQIRLTGGPHDDTASRLHDTGHFEDDGSPRQVFPSQGGEYRCTNKFNAKNELVYQFHVAAKDADKLVTDRAHAPSGCPSFGGDFVIGPGWRWSMSWDGDGGLHRKVWECQEDWTWKLIEDTTGTA